MIERDMETTPSPALDPEQVIRTLEAVKTHLANPPEDPEERGEAFTDLWIAIEETIAEAKAAGVASSPSEPTEDESADVTTVPETFAPIYGSRAKSLVAPTWIWTRCADGQPRLVQAKSGCGTGAGGFQPGNICAKGGGYSGPKTSDDISTLQDLESFVADVKDENLVTHGTRTPAQLESLAKEGIKVGRNGTVSTTPTTAERRGQINAAGVRDAGGGYVIIDGSKLEGKDITDVVSASEKYPERAFQHDIPPSAIVKVVREVPTGRGDHTISEVALARYALKNQGLNNADVLRLPTKYQKWFNLK